MNATWTEASQEPARREARLLGIAFAFILLNALALLLAPAVRAGSWDAFGRPAWALLVPVVWGASAWNLHRLLNRLHPGRDPVLLPVGLLLAGWGEFLILRLSTTFGLRQLLWLAVGVLLTTALLRAPAELRWLRRYRYVWLAGGLGLTALTLLLGTNPSGGEERLWLGCCGFRLLNGSGYLRGSGESWSWAGSWDTDCGQHGNGGLRSCFDWRPVVVDVGLQLRRDVLRAHVPILGNALDLGKVQVSD